MTSPQQQSTMPATEESAAKDRIYRSPLGMVGGLLLCLVICWLGGDALFQGHGRTPWLGLAGMVLLLPLVIAFTLRPAVFANEDRLRVRNPFRVITLPWGQVAALRSRFSNEVVADSGTTYQLWAVPVSLRARKRAARKQARMETDAARGRTGRSGGLGAFGGFSGLGGAGLGAVAPDLSGPARAETDKVMDDLRDLHDGHSGTAEGEITIRWAYEILAPALVGAITLAILLATG
ncbi:PH domain-containing protein [Streptomyces sp. LaPpAH-108]|uniref:PH domain-containing protein n=1 Tax=Streptomyces sp. LaPpAH-108 TaxID=1155714 RepID=UPI00036906BF|nr:PH domain-containing protein [Streptomyces sp. LaPpAH-108]